MTNKSTKKALLLSVLSMLVCVAMLVGTTFAWFTDSVTSGKNTITAGNLDIELEYSETPDVDSSWETVADATDLLDPEALWEPGHTEVVYLKISNLGTLALKYQFTMNIFSETVGKSVLGNDIYLSDHLMYGVVDYTEPFKTREDAIAAVESNAVALDNYFVAGEMLKGDAPEIVALVVYMPTTVGNEANYRGDAIPEIELGVELVATQLTSEEDFFNELYDEGAYLPVVYNAAELASALGNGDSVKLGSDIAVSESLNIAAGKDVVIDLNGKTLSADAALAAEVEPVIFNRGTLALKNGTISAVDTTGIRSHGSSAKLTLDNMTIAQENATDPEWLGSAVFTSGGATTVINSGNYSGTSSAAMVATSGGHLIVNGGTFEADVTTLRVDSWSYNSRMTVNGGTINVSTAGAKALYADGYKYADINGGTFNGTIDSTYTSININGGTFVDDLNTSISKNTKVNGTVTDNGDGTYTVAITAEDAKELIAAGGNVTLAGTIDMNGETVAIPDGTTISGGTIENATLTVADDFGASFEGVKFADTVAIKAQGDGELNLTDCEFDVNPVKNGFGRAGAIIGTNQYYTLDLNLDGCTFNYQYESGDADLWNNAIFMWSNVKSCVIKNCEFNGYGFVAVKLMNVADNAEITFEGNTFNMSKQGDANWYNNNAIQIVPQHNKVFTVSLVNNVFTGDYEIINGEDCVAYIDWMSTDEPLTNVTVTHSGNTINGEAANDGNFVVNP